ncbi:hypothetical protein [Nannocystis sp.]|uniref:hypothetical protein n=1 Tax=Nannocystis sp. TaxID=1962667 RepID=UPI0024217409|nr:hypothetical protein [Nannocystis sp.]MBK7825450.1 hypothetical protein [Nannocystis sp.]MBK9757102.1 hypothetical protein [Nannocystis sp.]
MRRVRGLVIVCGLLACDVAQGPEPAPLGELCGAQAPTLALALAPEQRLVSAPLYVEGGVLYRVAELAADSEPGLPSFGTSSLWAAGRCGEEPRFIDQVRSLGVRARWPGVGLACDSHSQLVAVQLAGGQAGGPTWPLYADCGLGWSGHGLIGRRDDGELGAGLYLYPDPPDLSSGPAEAIELLRPVATSGLDGPTFAALEDLVFVRTPDESVVSIDLRDGAVRVEQTGVRAFQVSADARYLLWQSHEVDDGVPAKGPVVLNDRELGISVALGATSLAYSSSSLAFAGRGLLVLTLGTYQQVYRLPELAVIDLPEGLVVDPRGPVDERQWLLHGDWSDETQLLDLATGEVRSLFPAAAQLIGRDESGLLEGAGAEAWLLELRRCCKASRFDAEGPVWRVPLAGGAPLRAAARASRYLRIVDDQLVTVVDIDADALGTLLRVDLNNGGEQLLDDRVFAPSLQADADAGVVTYSRVDGERSGVWQLRLPD